MLPYTLNFTFLELLNFCSIIAVQCSLPNILFLDRIKEHNCIFYYKHAQIGFLQHRLINVYISEIYVLLFEKLKVTYEHNNSITCTLYKVNEERRSHKHICETLKFSRINHLLDQIWEYLTASLLYINTILSIFLYITCERLRVVDT